MQLLNIDYIPGKEIEALGLVKGSVVQSKHLGKLYPDAGRGQKDRHQTDGRRSHGPGGRRHFEHPVYLRLCDAGRRRGHCLWYRCENQSITPDTMAQHNLSSLVEGRFFFVNQRVPLFGFGSNSALNNQ